METANWKKIKNVNFARMDFKDFTDPRFGLFLKIVNSLIGRPKHLC